jgi:hypothetical protein
LFIPLKSWPDVSRSPRDISRLFGSASSPQQRILRQALSLPDDKLILGLDLEFFNDNPHILGLSDGCLSVSVSWDDGRREFEKLLRDKKDNLVIVGHSVISSDLFVLRNMGFDIPVVNFEDTIILWWLTNMHLCKVSQKGSLDDGEIKRGQGYMNLGAMASIMTSLSNWKECRGEACDEICCPTHDVFGYNGIDSIAPVLALPSLIKSARYKGVHKLYPMHKELAYELEEMSRYGVKIDVDYVKKLEGDFKREKIALKEALPFNPNSGKQVKEFFRERDISLDDTEEETIRKAVEEHDDEYLDSLLEYKEMGKGTDSWFGPKFMDAHGFVHPRLGFYTSTARLMCANPNLQNISKRRLDRHNCVCGHKDVAHLPVCHCGCIKFKGQSIGKRVRQAIIAPEGYYIMRADYSNAENRVFLHMAGYEIGRDVDLHDWVMRVAGIEETDEFAISLGGARDAAKSIQHAGNYMEGLQLLDGISLKGKRIQAEIAAGARIIYPSWQFEGKTVSFTGINLAKRAFGSATYENRKKALDIAGKYFGKFDGVRTLQQRICQQIEKEKVVRPPHGYVLLSYGFAEERMKTAAACYGSQPVAHITKLALLDIARKFRAGRLMRPVLQIHDEVLTYVHKSIDPEEASKWLKESMELETPEIPGLVLPTDRSWGMNWNQQTEIE